MPGSTGVGGRGVVVAQVQAHMSGQAAQAGGRDVQVGGLPGMLPPAQQLEHPVPQPLDLDVQLQQRVTDVATGEPSNIGLQLLYDELVRRCAAQ